jgi:hypothetical protein
VKDAYALCDEVVKLFKAGAAINGNCKEITEWAQDMQVTYNITCMLYFYYYVLYIASYTTLNVPLTTTKYYYSQLLVLPNVTTAATITPL